MAVERVPATARSGIREVAAAAGVSESTVSNVLNNPQIVAAKTRRRVERAMEELDFVRNRAAGQLRGAPSSVVGSIVLDSANAFFAEVARAVEDRLIESGCMQLLFSSDLHLARENQCLKLLEEHAVRGIIINPVNPELEGLVRLGRRGTPVVLLDRSRGDADLCAVTADNVCGGELAAAHLLELGHRRIVFLGGSITVDTITARRTGADRACVAAGLDPAEVLVDIRHAPAAIDGPEAAVDHILALRPLPTAIICTNDTAAVGVLRGLRRAGVSVPARMSVIGYDDVHFASELSPPLTTVRQAKASLGRAAADLLLSEGDAGHRHQELVFMPEIIVRASTGNPCT